MRLQFGPAPLDCLWLPISGVAYGTGSTSRVAVLDALTFDGMGFRCLNGQPETWLIQNTNGLYVEPRRATQHDVEPNEEWEGLGAVELRNIVEIRGQVFFVRSLYRCPHLDFWEWALRDSQNGNRPRPDWCPSTVARLQRADIDSLRHLHRL